MIILYENYTKKKAKKRKQKKKKKQIISIDISHF